MGKLKILAFFIIAGVGFAFISNAQECAPAWVISVIDRSGSMSGTKLNDAKSAAQTFTSLLLPDTSSINREAVVTFDTAATDLLPGWSNDAGFINGKIGGISAGGGTSYVPPLTLAENLFSTASPPANAARVIIFLSDGLPGDSAQAQTKANNIKATGIIIFTIGLDVPGGSAAETLLKNIASSPAHYYSAPSSSDLDAIYKAIFLSLNDQDGDGFYSAACPGGTDWNDNNPCVNEEAPEGMICGPCPVGPNICSTQFYPEVNVCAINCEDSADNDQDYNIDSVDTGCPLIGGLVPCGRLREDPTTLLRETDPCTICHFFVLIKRIFDFVMRYIVFPTAVLMIAIGGLLFLTAAGDENKLRQGKTILTTAFLGIFIILIAWIGINTFLYFLTRTTVGGVTTIFGKAWNEIPCPICGDGICDPGETFKDCPEDCLTFLWVPLSAKNKLAQIDINSGSILNVYDLAPAGCNFPSRLTVMRRGDVWVGCRGSGNVIRLSPKFDELPKYEIRSTIPTGGITRAVTYDVNGYVWVGSCEADGEDITVDKIDPISGMIVGGANLSAEACAYGAIGDPFGNVWILNRQGNRVDKINTFSNTVTPVPLGIGPYGIGMDNDGDIWASGWENPGCLMWQINHVTNSAQCYPPVHWYDGQAHGRGIAVDKYNNVWVVVDGSGLWETAVSYVYKFDNNGHYLTHTQVGLGAVGVAVDDRDNIWVVNYGGGGPNCVGNCTGGSVTRLDINGNVIATYGFAQHPNIGTDSHPYNYSDMTGFRTMRCILQK